MRVKKPVSRLDKPYKTWLHISSPHTYFWLKCWEVILGKHWRKRKIIEATWINSKLNMVGDQKHCFVFRRSIPNNKLCDSKKKNRNSQLQHQLAWTNHFPSLGFIFQIQPLGITAPIAWWWWMKGHSESPIVSGVTDGLCDGEWALWGQGWLLLSHPPLGPHSVPGTQ